MDIRCARCGEPWDAYYLRHDMSWHVCDSCAALVVADASGRWRLSDREGSATVCDHRAATRHVAPADHGHVPEQVRAWYEAGQPGWLRFVATGCGCPSCAGRPATPAPLSLAELDDIEAATEGMSDWL